MFMPVEEYDKTEETQCIVKTFKKKNKGKAIFMRRIAFTEKLRMKGTVKDYKKIGETVKECEGRRKSEGK